MAGTPRILFVSANRGGGGSEELWVQAAGKLVEMGVDVLAATTWTSRAADRLSQLHQTGVRHETLEETTLDRISRRLNPRKRSSSRPLGKLMRSWRPTLVFFNSGTLLDGLDLLEEVSISGLPYLTLTHLVSTDNWPDDAMAESLFGLFSGAKSAGFVSEHNFRLFETQVAAVLSNSRLWRNPFLVRYDLEPIWPEGETMRLAFPARIHPRTKGHDLLLQVMGQEKWLARPINVSVFGRGPWEKSLSRLIRQRGLENVVEFRGHTRDIQGIWDEHHALLLPSRHEGLPICVVEAMMAARPCIVNPAGGSAELLEDEVTGFVARECSSTALDEALERAWQRRFEWQTIGSAAAASVRSVIPPDPAGALAHELLKRANEG